MNNFFSHLIENKSLLYGILTGVLSVTCTLLSIINGLSLIRERRIKLSVSFGLGFTIDGKGLMNFYSPTNKSVFIIYQKLYLRGYVYYHRYQS